MTEPARGIHADPDRKLGKKPPQPGKRALMLRQLLTGALPEHPPTADYLYGIEFGLYGNDRYGDCVAPDTRVLTADLRWVRAGDLLVGDRLLGFDEESNGYGRSYRSAVIEQARIVKRPCYDLTFADGTQVRSSSGHRWLTQSTVQGQLRTQQWVETQHLKLGPLRQSRVVKPLEVWDTDRSFEGGYLAAAFDGEGNLEQTRHGIYANRVCFSQTENEMLAEVERCLKELGYRFNHTVTSNGRQMRVDGTPRKDKHRLEVSPRPDYIRFLGSVRPARLLPKLDVDRLGRIHGEVVHLVGKEFVGEQDVVMLDTTARTYIAEGLASHNCGPVAIANLRRLTTYDLTGVMQAPSQDDVFDLYRRSTTPPFDPVTGANDYGVYLQQMLEAVHAGGIGAIRCVAFAKIDVSDHETLRAATAIFGGVLYGVDLQTAQQRQTNTGTWDYALSGEWGGHAVPGGQYDADSLRVVTWAELVDMTNSFVTHQADEAWVVIWPEHFGSKAFLQGVDVVKLAAGYEQLTGEQLPIPSQPVPEPVSPPQFLPALPDWARARMARRAAKRKMSVEDWVTGVVVNQVK